MSSGDDGLARFWDGWTGEPVGQFEYGHTIAAANVSPDGSRLALGNYDGALGVEPCENISLIHRVVLTGQGAGLVMIGKKNIRIWQDILNILY